MMKDQDFYTNAHLIAAAIRILEHRNATPPSIDEVCQTLSFSLEHGRLICRKLQKMEIIDMVEGTYGTRLFIKNHLQIEEIPRGTKESKLGDELKKFQDSQKKFTQKIESFQAEQEKKKKNLFAEIEQKMKKELDKK